MGVVSSRWMLVEYMGVVVRRYIDYLILLIPTLVYICSFLQQHPYSCIYLFFFAAASLLFVHFKIFFVLVPVHFCN